MKNIILLMTDTFRYDNLKRRAARPVRTPELDRFAEERAAEIHGYYIGSFPTIPQRTDLATGRLGWLRYGWQPIDLSSPNHIAALLRQAGYATQLICDCPHLFNARFQHAFDAAFQHRGQEGDFALLRLNDPIPTVMAWEKTRTKPAYRGHTLPDMHAWMNRQPRYETEMFAPRTAETAVRWLEENHRAHPFFLWVDFFDPHEPWDPPEYLVRRYDPDYDGPPMVHPNYGPSSVYTPEELHNLRAHYAAESELTDRWIGRVLQKIDDLALWDDSIVVVTSDHGMSLGEHARTGKSNLHDDDPRYWALYPEVSHALLLMAGGGIPAGGSLDLFAQPMDLLPTLCELSGASVNPPAPFQGRSFAGALRSGTGRHRDYVVSGCYVRTQGGQPPRRASTPFLATAQWGYAPAGARGTPELYDLTADPLAENDVADRHPAVVTELHALLLEYLKEHDAPEECLQLWSSTGRAGEEGSGGSWAIDYA